MNNMNIKICFMGTPSFASKPLLALINADFNISCIYTKAPKPKGRSQKLQYSHVHEIALKYNIDVKTPKTLRTVNSQEEFCKKEFDLCIIASYGLILPKAILESPKYGCINLHASILPKYRGASPIQAAILNGDTQSGLTYMKMNEGLDTGDIISIHKTPIDDQTTFTQLYETLGDIGAQSIISEVNNIVTRKITPIKQDDNLASHCGIIKKEQGLVNFNLTAHELHNQIRAYEIFPSTYFFYNNELFKIIKAKPIVQSHSCEHGTIISNIPLLISCKDSILEIQVIQRQGKKAMTVEEFSKGFIFPINLKLH